MGALTGKRVAVVEDDAVLSMELADLLEAAGATVVGQAFNLPKALAMAETLEEVDCAVCDVNLRGEMSYPAALAFQLRGVPVAFATAERPEAIPDDFAGSPILQKPYIRRAIVEAVVRLTNEE
jgi:CheY-like chemotaxis protein